MRGKAVPAADGTVAPQAASQANGHVDVHQLAAAAADSRGTGAAGRAAQVRDADVAVMPPLVPIVKAASSSAYHVNRIQEASANSRALCVLDLEGHLSGSAPSTRRWRSPTDRVSTAIWPCTSQSRATSASRPTGTPPPPLPRCGLPGRQTAPAPPTRGSAMRTSSLGTPSSGNSSPS